MACFKVPESICNKMDEITRAFWWGHDSGVRKMHLINWDRVCNPKRDGGMGLKKFSLINQAMLVKQYWRISQNPHSLISRTFKARYFPRGTIHDSKPKAHHSWFWGNIISSKNNKLKEGKWLIGSGHDIPLDHLAWYPLQADQLNNPNFRFGIVANLIDYSSHNWKAGLVRAVYSPQVSSEILRTPISKVGVSPDILVWKHSSSGNYNVNCAYNLLHRGSSNFNEFHSRQHNDHTAFWNVVWKVGVPLKVCNFVWRLLHDSLPTTLTWKSKGIPVDSSCPLCNEGDESTSHLFLRCTFARAVWHGSALVIHTSALPHSSIQSWIRALLFKHKRLDQNSMHCL